MRPDRRKVGLRQSILAFVSVMLCPAATGFAQDLARFATEDSRADYVHRIELYDSRNSLIKPGSFRPYSPSKTCGRCHDMAKISRGFHFAADANVQDHGRTGEPWIWVDPTTGTQLPLSYRGWKNAYSTEALGISLWDFTLRFGKRSCGGYSGRPTGEDPSEPNTSTANDDQAKTDATNSRFHLSGPLEVDCMVCHARDATFDLEVWSKQIDSENFSWASTVAIGLATVKGAVRRLPDDFDAASAMLLDDANSPFPKTSYDPRQFDAEGKVFLDIVRSPANNACYLCHSWLAVGKGSEPIWKHEEDIHLRAGLRCVDCHPNALGHETVRGFEGEVHPEQQYAASLSCRGCHIGPATEGAVGQFSSGRMGAPYAEHRGLPPIHLERLACTACHAGPLPNAETHLVQTSRNHLLGQQAHRKEQQQPEIVEPVLLPDEHGKLYPHRVVWPSYWGTKGQAGIEPLKLSDVQQALKGVIRARRDFVEELSRVPLTSFQKAKILGEERASLPIGELTEVERSQLAGLQQEAGRREFHKKLLSALVKLRESRDSPDVVFVAGEKLYQLDGDSNLQIVDNPQAKPYAWPIGHDVRPARWALGANGCTDCHANESPFLYASVTAEAPVPVDDLRSRPMYEYAELDKSLWNVWHESIKAKPLLLWSLAGTSLCLVGVILVRGAKPDGQTTSCLQGPWSFAERLVYGGFVATVALLGLSALTAMLRFGAMHDWWLVAHVLAAGAYLIFVVIMALKVSHRFAVVQSPRPSDGQPATAEQGSVARGAVSWLAKRAYWLMLTLCLVAVGTMFLSMLPVFGTRNLENLFAVHRYCGLVLLVIALVHPLLLRRYSR